MDNFLIAPSTDPAKTIEEIINYAHEIQDYVDFLHCDIMDGKFVSATTFLYDHLKNIKENTLLPLDVHLMIQNPEKYIKNYIDNGANILTVHFEAFKNKKQIIKTLKQIKKLGALCGLAIKPQTTINEIIPFLSYCDLILIMSVEPGKSGQTFMESAYDKVANLNKIKNDYNSNLLIEVDGGINPEISNKLKHFGADIIVSGSFVYNSKNRAKAVQLLKEN